MAKAVKSALTVFAVVMTVGVAWGIGLGIGAGTGAFLAMGTALTYAGYTFVATGIAMLTQKGIDIGADNFSIKQTIKGATNSRQIVYGETVVGGTLAYVSTSGTDNTKLHMIVMFAGHEIQSLEKLIINGVDATTASSTVSGETVYRVTNADFVNTENPSSFTSGSLLRYTFHDGASDQSADGLAVANLTDITSDHRLRGIAYVYIECIFDREKWSGFPQITAKIKGKKVYDPRDSSTAWSANPALCIRDYLMDTTNGVGALSTEINDANVAGSFYTAANTCDTDIATTGGATEDKYTLNGFFNTSGEPSAVMESMLSSCAGKIAYANGKFNLFVGEAQTASLTVTDDDLLSPIDIQGNRGESFNGVKAVYVDKDNDYQAGDMPPFQSSTYLNADTPSGGATANFEKYLQLQYPFTLSQFTAQRLGRIGLNHSRQSLIISCLVNMGFYRLQVGDWVKVTNSRMSFTNKYFEVQAVGFEPTEDNFLGTRLVLKEIASSVFTFDTDNDYVAFATTGSTPTTGGTTVTAPSNLTLTALSTFVVGNTGIMVSWTKAVSSIVTQTEVEYKKTSEADSTYISAPAVPYASAQQRVVLTETTPNTGYTVRIRSYSSYYDNHSSYVTGTVTTGGTVVGANDITNSNMSLTLSGTGLTLNNGGGSTQTFSNSSVGLNNVTNHTQIKDDASNAPDIIKNDQISISQGNSGVFTLTRFSGSTDTTTITKGKLGLSYDDGATVGAIAGTNLKDSSNNTLNDVDVRNDDLAIDYSGTDIRIKKSSTVIDTQATPAALKNDQISIGSNGVLSGAGGGTVTASGISAVQTSLGNAPAAIKNDNISISAGSSGVLTLTRYSGATDTTTITKNNLGLSYTDGATNNGTTINSSGNVSGAVTVASGGTIVAGNITIDGTNGRILITD